MKHSLMFWMRSPFLGILCSLVVRDFAPEIANLSNQPQVPPSGCCRGLGAIDFRTGPYHCVSSAVSSRQTGRIQPLQLSCKPSDPTRLSTFESGQGHRPSHKRNNGITFTIVKTTVIKITSLISICPFYVLLSRPKLGPHGQTCGGICGMLINSWLLLVNSCSAGRRRGMSWCGHDLARPKNAYLIDRWLAPLASQIAGPHLRSRCCRPDWARARGRRFGHYHDKVAERPRRPIGPVERE